MTTAARPDLETGRHWLSQVPDPEIPVISLTDLGIIRDVAWQDDTLVVTVTPTYSGCPATTVINLGSTTAGALGSTIVNTPTVTFATSVTAIGGLKEKLLAAHRGGIKTVMIPEENEKDLQDIPENVKNHLEIVPVKWIDRVLEVALQSAPQPLPENPGLNESLPSSTAARPGPAGMNGSTGLGSDSDASCTVQ